MNPTTLAVVIVSFNGEAFIQEAIESVINEAKVSKIFVVDNASNDATLSLIPMHPKIEVIRLSENVGFGSANNIALTKVLDEEFQYVFLMNQDARLEKGTIGALVQVAESRRWFGILSPLHLDGTGQALDRNFGNYLKSQGAEGLLEDCLISGKLEDVYPLPFVNAAAWLVTRECLERVGGFDPSFFMYGEDDNYCHRVAYHGLSIGVVPKARIYHAREDRSPKQNLQQRGGVAKSRVRALQIKLSNPSISDEEAAKTIDGFRLGVIRDGLSSLLRGRMKNAKQAIRIFLSVNETVDSSRRSAELSRKPGPTFLESKL